MSKPLKNKKDRVPKITEEEYAEYLSSLKAMEESVLRHVEKTPISAITDCKNNEK